jgi:arsenate reductase
MDVVITVCDNAAGETCPVWPARDGEPPRKLHWSFPDPAAIEGGDAEKRAAFETVFADIRAHIDAFLKATAPKDPA